MDVARTIADCTGATVASGERKGSAPSTPIQGRIPRWSPRLSLEDGIQRMVIEARQRMGAG